MPVRIILQIHDELVVEVAPGEAERVTALVKDAMEHAVDMAVPLDVSTGIGSDWQLAAHWIRYWVSCVLWMCVVEQWHKEE